MHIPFFQVDAFTHQPFKGNPAAICFLDTPLSDSLLQSIAIENNLAETAFLLPLAPAKDATSARTRYNLRWFSPRMEMPLCGHATLATAHLLWELGKEPVDKTLEFDTLSGVLTASLQDDWIELNFPARSSHTCPIPEELKQLFPKGYNNIEYSVDRYIVELPSAADVHAFTPDAPFLQKHRIVITSRGEAESPYDFISRYFAAPVGVTEDPVTGTAHCSLATYWADRQKKTKFFAYQASPRGGELKLVLHGDRVSLIGEAVTVIEGRINI